MPNYGIVRTAAVISVLTVTVSVVLHYSDYFPPNFGSDFLLQRKRYFFGAYQWAFYAHIVSGPCSLLLGLILLSESFRRRYRRWHQMLGRIQTVSVLLVVVPSGLWMSFYAATGGIAGSGFAVLAIGTGTCITLGWKAAVQRRFADHQRWMQRSFALLCSAVVIRLIGGLATVLVVESDWVYQASAWLSWLAPLAVLELRSWFNGKHPRMPLT